MQNNNSTNRLRVRIVLVVAALSAALLAQAGPAEARAEARAGTCTNAKPATAQKTHLAFTHCAKTVGLGAAVAAFLDPSGMFVVAGEGVTLGAQGAERIQAALAGLKTISMRSEGELASRDADHVVMWGAWQDDNSFTLVWARAESGHVRLVSGVLSRSKIAPDVVEPPIAIEPGRARSERRALAAVTLAEAQFGGLCGTNGMAAAFEAQADDLLAIVRDADGRLAGKKNVLADTRVASERWRYVPLHTGVAKSNDLAFVTGRYSMWKANGAVERGYFTRVWKSRNGADPADSSNWKVVIDAAATLSR
jgi:hypothetical protein